MIVENTAGLLVIEDFAGDRLIATTPRSVASELVEAGEVDPAEAEELIAGLGGQGVLGMSSVGSLGPNAVVALEEDDIEQLVNFLTAYLVESRAARATSSGNDTPPDGTGQDDATSLHSGVAPSD